MFNAKVKTVTDYNLIEFTSSSQLIITANGDLAVELCDGVLRSLEPEYKEVAVTKEAKDILVERNPGFEDVIKEGCYVYVRNTPVDQGAPDYTIFGCRYKSGAPYDYKAPVTIILSGSLLDPMMVAAILTCMCANPPVQPL